ncbi:FecCD family ABC transporter permease [Neptunomonas qingdaonensis]|uniref:Iron complex transport system permease protein n=1 Tax=Neptunomonas qingdaonensis TaxID=1045558 RepID=A0A1I2VZ05_9GAMM|nr:iron ABC transporter permease [Neptunomonas qingdaonensis]SFG93639.1 iron complex transport system permease protein [Neptunomonas qingdaonensis]
MSNQRMKIGLWISAWVLLPMLMLVSLLNGSAVLSLSDIWEGSDLSRRILYELRLPRVLLVMLSGGLLAIAGAVVQALFRNPLADPGLIGVSGGAALAAVAWQVVASAALGSGIWVSAGTPLAAFAGGMLVTFFVIRIARNTSGISALTLLLTGIAINAIAGAGIAGLKYLSDSMTLRQVTFWLMGNVQGASWWAVLMLLLISVIFVPVLIRHAVRLNLLLLGEQQALLLGVDVEKTQRRLVLITALMVGAVVSMVGLIGFVGLVVPHLVRLMNGPDNRFLLPMSFLLGALLLLLADLVARIIAAPAELPIGLITALIGGPVFLFMIAYQQRGRGAC